MLSRNRITAAGAKTAFGKLSDKLLGCATFLFCFTQCRYLRRILRPLVQRFANNVANGMFAIMSRLGLTPEEIQRRQMSFAVVHAETDFHRELHSGDVMLLESTVLKLGDKSATFQHRLRNLTTDGVAMTTDFKCVLLDLRRRETISPPLTYGLQPQS